MNKKSIEKAFPNNFSKDDIRKWIFSDEKVFDTDGVYNDRIWPASRAEANKEGGLAKKRKFPAMLML